MAPWDTSNKTPEPKLKPGVEKSSLMSFPQLVDGRRKERLTSTQLRCQTNPVLGSSVLQNNGTVMVMRSKQGEDGASPLYGIQSNLRLFWCRKKKKDCGKGATCMLELDYDPSLATDAHLLRASVERDRTSVL